ncbi:GGDEF domain-containing protein [Methylophaga sp. OBS3]|uniref:GGDEF domain-containing protein n=1 Tax=Methylophaga sp. OBS3 TaxID=2991934 RepID=UPI00225840A2|nr:diguanylate cyclase [Methylophaga sp. OBS3]MCX4190015.1 GGDEF domain-containing protein [Methylophaga sp. OBS3]
MNTNVEQENTTLITQAAFLAEVASQWQTAMDNEDAISLFLIDVDEFDGIRHKSGCVRKIVKALESILNRESDFICHFSRKKIMFLTSNMTYQQTRQLAVRIHQHVASLSLRQVQDINTSPPVTVSIGHTSYTPTQDGQYGVLDIISCVLKLCQQAKEAGGNCTKTRLHSRVLG